LLGLPRRRREALLEERSTTTLHRRSMKDLAIQIPPLNKKKRGFGCAAARRRFTGMRIQPFPFPFSGFSTLSVRSHSVSCRNMLSLSHFVEKVEKVEMNPMVHFVYDLEEKTEFAVKFSHFQ